MIIPISQRVMLFIFTLSVMQVIVFCLAIGDPTDLHIAIVNHEMDWETKDCPISLGCDFNKLSCRYVNDLRNDTIINEYYNTTGSAVHAVEVGDAWGAIYFTENFTDALVARLALGIDADNETVEQSDVHVWLDMSSRRRWKMLSQELSQQGTNSLINVSPEFPQPHTQQPHVLYQQATPSLHSVHNNSSSANSQHSVYNYGSLGIDRVVYGN